MALSLLRTIPTWFRPAFDALFTLRLPWAYRWRLLALQPLNLVACAFASYRYWRTRPYTTELLPIAPGRTLRVLVFMPPEHPPGSSGNLTKPNAALRPLHINCHAGAFVGGIPESSAEWCARVAADTGAVVLATTYRLAPRHVFPAAHDDVDALVAYLRVHARTRFGADPALLTTSGFSAGSNLALATALAVSGTTHRVKAAVGFYAPVDLRLAPMDKPWGPTEAKPGFVAGRDERANPGDPFAFLLPLYDAYSGPVRARNMENPRMSPVIADIGDLPENILLVIPEMDILVHEQSVLIERLKFEAARDPKYAGRRYESIYDAKGFHSWLELPPFIIPQEIKDEKFGAGTAFLKDVHERHGFIWK